ncbi:hypothetical protein PQR37_29365 [Paraburkholderia nemoris]|uniref:hypothetical protein n=1 Tax=Paraburkholderia nemoris TaxID=2793076 RepID=UPI0038BC8AE4
MKNTNALLKSLTTLVASNSETISSFGAQIVVMGNFLDATFPHLTAVQCAKITKSFRHEIEKTMSLMDDVPLPAEYHSMLLAQTNSLLNMLHARSAARR